MNLTEIITEADLLVPNTVSTADKVVALNGFNQDFFNVVKIPSYESFESVQGQKQYILNGSLREKNIFYVSVGVIKYKPIEEDTPNPMKNLYFFDDSTSKMSLFPAPYQSGLSAIIRFHKIATTVFSSSNLSAVPDAPTEYHFTFIWALASYIANTQDDAIKASNYENQYKAAWNVAAQNYAKEVQA